MNITLSKHLKLENIPPEFKAELIDTLTVFNPKWIENQRLNRWNQGTPRTLKYFRKSGESNLFVPRGYLRQLILDCREKEIEYTLVDKRRFLKEIEYTFNGALKPFQVEACKAMLKKDFGTLNAPTGSGKTIMALYMIAQRKQPALVIVHTKELAQQWKEKAETFLALDPQEIGQIGGGQDRVGERLTIAMVQSLYKRTKQVAKKIGFLITDECHRCPSRTFTKGVTAFDSAYMLGLSATPYRRDQLNNLIFWHLGDMHHSVDRSRLERNGDILRAEVIMRETTFTPFHDPTTDYSKMLSELTGDPSRNHLIAQDIALETQNHEGVSLVLSDRKAHCENLGAILKFKHRLAPVVLTGDIPVKKRQEILKDVNDGKVNILIATGQLVGEGFDCPQLSTLFLATPIKFGGRLLQYLGRILRSAPGKKGARVFDYVDVEVEVLRYAAQSRMKAYQKE